MSSCSLYHTTSTAWNGSSDLSIFLLWDISFLRIVRLAEFANQPSRNKLKSRHRQKEPLQPLAIRNSRRISSLSFTSLKFRTHPNLYNSLILATYSVGRLEIIVMKKMMTRRKKTSCFGGFCLNLRVKLASECQKIPGN